MSYEPTGLALEIFRSRHAAHAEETWKEAGDRVALHVSNAEVGQDRDVWRARFAEVLHENLFMPGGRIWYGAGRPRGQLLNCFVVPTSDSREGWGKTVSDTIVISGMGGGVGINFSPSRPRDSLIRGTGGKSTGSVSEMVMVNAVGEVIKAGGGRRVALMFCLSLSHGDVVEFMDKKLDRNELNNANVSVVFDDDPERFFDLVREGGDWPLVHQGREVGRMPARLIWDRIVTNALKRREGDGGGEPGLLNGYLANKMSNIWYVEQLVSTNPCQPAWTTVLTPDGIRTIGDIKIGDKIWSGKQWTTITNKWSTGVKQVKAYRTRAGTFYGTENHRIVENGVKVEVRYADAIDAAASPDAPNEPAGTFEITRIQDISVEEVFDLTVDAEEHTYWTDGLLVSNCGEIWLSPYDCCCLGSVVLPRFVRGGKVDWAAMKDVVTTGVRFLDDVLTTNTYPLPEIQEKCSQLRRIGLGVTGLHHMLLELGLKYNGTDGLEFVDGLMKRIKNWSYEASSDLAAQKGSFPLFDAEKFLRSGFLKTLKPSLREKILRDGMRNCACNTIAPAGTISMVCDTSSGVEPVYAPAHERRFRRGDEKAMEVVIDPLFQRFVSEGRDVRHFVGALDISIRDHLEMQRVCQKHVDNAVSKTINLPHGTKPEELSELYMEFFPDLKGVTVYPDGSREDQPLTPIPFDQALNLAKNAQAKIGASVAEDKCRNGKCDL